MERAPGALPAVLRFVAPWGPFAPATSSCCQLGTAPSRRGASRCDAAAGSGVVAVDAGGDPALVVASAGTGHAVTLSHPLELLLAADPDAHGPGDRSWGLYAGLAALAGAAGPAGVGHPEASVGVVAGAGGAAAVLANHGRARVEIPVIIAGDPRSAMEVGPAGARPVAVANGIATVTLEPHAVTIVAWRD